ncbi:MAG: helix-turn-helix transcriptional regulator [Nocardioidaceae bacterium]
MSEFEHNVEGIGALTEPVRRELYFFVCAQPAPVSRDQAADAVGIARHQAKFHLDRLEADGLLESEYARLTGRTGPGAGRPSKLYRRTAGEIAVSLPQREYELAGRLMADAIVESERTGTPVLEALRGVAVAYGETIGDTTATTGRPRSAKAALDLAVDVLKDNGYEPRREGGRAVMANCPFHALAKAQTALVCEMNHALITGFVQRVAPDRLDACLEPGDDRCCVVVTATPARI